MYKSRCDVDRVLNKRSDRGPRLIAAHSRRVRWILAELIVKDSAAENQIVFPEGSCIRAVGVRIELAALEHVSRRRQFAVKEREALLQE